MYGDFTIGEIINILKRIHNLNGTYLEEKKKNFWLFHQFPTCHLRTTLISEIIKETEKIPDWLTGFYKKKQKTQQRQCFWRSGINPWSSHTKDFKMVLYTSLLNTLQYKVVSRVRWSNPGKGVALSPTPRCSSYWKGSLLVALNYGRQLYFFI